MQITDFGSVNTCLYEMNCESCWQKYSCIDAHFPKCQLFQPPYKKFTVMSYKSIQRELQKKTFSALTHVIKCKKFPTNLASSFSERVVHWSSPSLSVKKLSWDLLVIDSSLLPLRVTTHRSSSIIHWPWGLKQQVQSLGQIIMEYMC